MLTFPESVHLPLRVDLGDVIRIGPSRVTLQTVVYHFQQGASPEEIVNRYPSLRLGDVYIVLGYYLERQSELDAYVREQEQLADEAYDQYEKMYIDNPLRAKLLAKLERAKEQRLSEGV